MSELPRTALERVLARASELQTTGSAEPGDTISEARLVEIAKEVGLDVQHVRQAIAEERAQVVLAEPENGPLLSSLGPSVVSAQRTVTGSPSELLARLEGMLPRLEMMVPIRRTGDRLMLEPRQDTIGNFMRSLGVGGRRFDLVRLDQLVVTATRVDEGRTVLRFDAVMAGARSSERTSAMVISVMLFLLAAAVAIPAFVFSLVLPGFAIARWVCSPRSRQGARGSPGARCVADSARSWPECRTGWNSCWMKRSRGSWNSHLRYWTGCSKVGATGSCEA